MAVSTIRRILGPTLLACLGASVLAPVGPAAGSTDGLRRLDAELVQYRSALASGPQAFASLAPAFASIARGSGPTVALRARLVEADCLDRSGQHGRALILWRSLEGSDPAIATYCRFRIGGADAIAGARRAVGPFAPDLLIAAGQASSDRRQAAVDLERALELAPQGPLAEQALYLLATDASGSGQQAALRYLRAFPDGPHSAEVSRSLEVSALSLSQREHLAGTMLDTGDYSIAIMLLAGDPAPMALYRLGRAYWKLGQRDKALTYFRKSLTLDPHLASRIALTRGQMAMGERQWRLAIAPLRMASFDRGPIGLDALDALTHVYLELNDDASSAAIDRQIIASYPDSGDASDARWRAMWKAMEAGKRAQARYWARRLARTDGEIGIAGQYWLGRMDQDSGNLREALAAYADVRRRADRLPPSWYYAWRARMRTDALTGRAPDPGFTVVDGPVEPRPFALGGLLARSERAELGLGIRRALPGVRTWPEDLRVLAYLCLVPADRLPPGRARMLVAAAEGNYAQAISWAETADRAGTGYSRLAEDPLGFWSALEPAARSQGLDPLFLAALVKQESFFNPKSVSWAGAIGLAQLMPTTASWVGHELGGSGSLYDPAWNLRCGAWYLAYTGRIFDRQGIFEAAAYNAGVAAVRRWRSSFGSVYATDPERFIEEIPFFETRHYVKKVYGYYWTYRELYRPRT